MPIVIGLTGGIGCGKSHVLQTLVALGAEGIDADKVAHEVMTPDGAAYKGLLAEFGPEIVGPDGVIDRARLGALVFRSPKALARLESIVHPAVYQVTRERVERSSAPVVVIEAIKLLEAGLSVQLCDQVWVVVCSEAAQLERLASSRGMPADEVRWRRANQMAQDQMAAAADLIIDTNGTLAETEQQVRRAWRELGLALPSASSSEARDHA